tara:strand:- start:507 stop:839 length:333 start_codon:yes stop_codon:yes gene_type:complete
MTLQNPTLPIFPGNNRGDITHIYVSYEALWESLNKTIDLVEHLSSDDKFYGSIDEYLQSVEEKREALKILQSLVGWCFAHMIKAHQADSEAIVALEARRGGWIPDQNPWR